MVMILDVYLPRLARWVHMFVMPGYDEEVLSVRPGVA
jgi:hypothetical protein